MTNKKESVGSIKVGDPTAPREIGIKDYVTAEFAHGTKITIGEMQNNEGYLIAVNNPPNSGR